MLPCVDVFVADEFFVFRLGAPHGDSPRFCVGAPNLRTCLAGVRWGAQLADVPCVAFGRPTCGRALRCVWAPNLRTCLALRLGAQLADVPCVAFGRPTCGRALRSVGAPNLRTCLALCWGAQLADVPCVAFGRPTCGRALRCVGAPNLGEAVLKSLPPSQNLFLSILQLVF